MSRRADAGLACPRSWQMNRSSWFGADGDSSSEVLWEDGERLFLQKMARLVPMATGNAVLAVLPAAEHPTPPASIVSHTNMG